MSFFRIRRLNSSNNKKPNYLCTLTKKDFEQATLKAIRINKRREIFSISNILGKLWILVKVLIFLLIVAFILYLMQKIPLIRWLFEELWRYIKNFVKG